MSILNKIDDQMNKILLFMNKNSNYSHKNSSYDLILFDNRYDISLLNISAYNNNNRNMKTNCLITPKDNQIDLITYDNFPFSHLCNHDIRDLPLSKDNSTDLDRLRSCYILTITDLIGRYLIHKTSNDFRQFLRDKVQCSQTFIDQIVQLMELWTLHNLQIGRETSTKTLKQYL